MLALKNFLATSVAKLAYKCSPEIGCEIFNSVVMNIKRNKRLAHFSKGVWNLHKVFDPSVKYNDFTVQNTLKSRYQRLQVCEWIKPIYFESLNPSHLV